MAEELQQDIVPRGWGASLGRLGSGPISGADDDDPSGIATCSQAGAQFGFSRPWTVVFTLPLSAAIRNVSARIGCVTRRDLAAMAEALRLLVDGSAHVCAVPFGLLCLVPQVFLPHASCGRRLKWLTLEWVDPSPGIAQLHTHRAPHRGAFLRLCEVRHHLADRPCNACAV